ncbi:hypothetical protein [Noviherbaspirillum galbum]|uniref:Uncharacterized protein n=1 Tax=Noviherbaspirillum galbum TaxID=2709383 RepID=A0A6B3SNB6_9BURK|nr:hypothetical protein [Noviherbaspirillum galbum]NEX62253.1 hypothetical protein [Noviherbaspirillum galbum]
MRYLLALVLFLPALAWGADCVLLARMQNVQVRDCGRPKLESLGPAGEILSEEDFPETPTGIEHFRARQCRCELWQVVGSAGSGSRIARFYRAGENGALQALNGASFRSDSGLIGRYETLDGLFIEVQEADPSGRHLARKVYAFDGNGFVLLRRPPSDDRSR